MDNSLNAARVVAYTGAIVAAIPLTDDWKIAIPFVGIAMIEFVLIAHKLVDMARGKAFRFIVDEAADRAVLQIRRDEQRTETMGTIARLRGVLPDTIVDAAEEGRLLIDIDED